MSLNFGFGNPLDTLILWKVTQTHIDINVFFFINLNSTFCGFSTESFERAMTNVLRLETGKKTLTSSEGEERGRGLRPKSLKLRDSESDTCDNSPVKKQHKPKRLVTEFPDPPHFKKAKMSKPGPSTVTVSAPVSEPAGVPGSTLISSPSPSTPRPSSEKKCKVARRHHCPFVHGPVTLETLAHSLCALSSKLLDITFKRCFGSICLPVISSLSVIGSKQNQIYRSPTFPKTMIIVKTTVVLLMTSLSARLRAGKNVVVISQDQFVYNNNLLALRANPASTRPTASPSTPPPPV